MHRRTTPVAVVRVGGALVLLGALAAPASAGDKPGGAVEPRRETDLMRVEEEPALAALQEEDEAGEGEPAPDEGEWKSKVVVGAGATTGNTDNQSFHAGLSSLRERVAERTEIDLHYYYGATDGDRTENRFTAGLLQDWLVADSPWLYFAKARYDYDEFNSWEQRVAVHAGVGYEFIDREDLSLVGRVGLGLIKEVNSANDGIRPEGLLGLDLRWDITERQTLEAGTTLYPDLGDLGEFRTISYARWDVLVDEASNLSFNIGVEHEYQSVVDPGREKNDFRITAGLLFEF